MKKGALWVLVICLLFATFTGCKNAENLSQADNILDEPEQQNGSFKIRDNIKEINDDTLLAIAHNYFIIYNFDETIANCENQNDKDAEDYTNSCA